jgi:hypothetical protein
MQTPASGDRPEQNQSAMSSLPFRSNRPQMQAPAHQSPHPAHNPIENVPSNMALDMGSYAIEQATSRDQCKFVVPQDQTAKEVHDSPPQQPAPPPQTGYTKQYAVHVSNVQHYAPTPQPQSRDSLSSADSRGEEVQHDYQNECRTSERYEESENEMAQLSSMV